MTSVGIIIAFTVLVLLLTGSSLFCLRLIKKYSETSKELSKERQFLNYVLEATNTNINITDTDFNLQYVDPSWQKVYGNPTGRKCYEYFMGRTEPCENCGIPEALKKKTTIVYEELMPSENGRIVEVHTIPFKDLDGKWLVAEFNVDITRRKKAEEALQTAQRLESLGILAGGIAHDFNNLLTGIFSNIDIASELTDNEEIRKHLSQASDSIERTRSLTGQLLTFAKGGTPVKKTDQLPPFIKKTVNFALSGSNTSCRFNISDDILLCEFDRNQIGQVIDNLVINAKQAMKDGGSIEVSAENISINEDNDENLAPGKYVSISVKDSGSGISSDILPKIFDPFFTTKEKGAGLGLATSFSIVKRHGGHIKVSSEEGKGSTFTVFLPATTKTVSEEKNDIGTEHIGKGTFLIMDDQEIIRMTTGKIMENLGYSVVTQSDGADAVDYFLKNGKNLTGMIFDLTIPGGMGGIDAVTEIRKTDKNIPIFVSSGYADDPVMSNPEEYGFNGSITKPFTKEELIQMLNRFIKSRNIFS